MRAQLLRPAISPPPLQVALELLHDHRYRSLGWERPERVTLVAEQPRPGARRQHAIVEGCGRTLEACREGFVVGTPEVWACRQATEGPAPPRGLPGSNSQLLARPALPRHR